MNALDVLIAVIFGFCLIRGIFRGLVKELSSIIGVFAGYYFAYSYYGYAAEFLSRWMANPGYASILAFLIVFCGVFLLISIVGVVLKYLMKITFLGWVDRICGAGFGGIKGILIVSVLLVIFTAFLPKGAPVLKNSLLTPHVVRVSQNLVKVVPRDMKKEFSAKLDQLKKEWKIQ